MAFTNSNDYITGRKPVPTAAGNEVVATRFEIDLVAADLDLNDAGTVAILPAGHVPVAIIYDSDDLDTNASPTIAASVGLMNSGDTDLDGTAWATGITASQGGTAVQLTLTTAAMRLAASTSDRRVGVKFTAAAATKAAGKIGLTLLYRPV